VFSVVERLISNSAKTFGVGGFARIQAYQAQLSDVAIWRLVFSFGVIGQEAT